MKKDEKVTVGYPLRFHELEYALMSAYSALELANNPRNIRFLFAFDDVDKHHSETWEKTEQILKDFFPENDTIILDPHPYYSRLRRLRRSGQKEYTIIRGGWPHGLNLDLLIDYSYENNWNKLLVADSDTFFLKRGWDEYMTKNMEDCLAVGSGMPQGHHQNYEGFPYIDFCMLNVPLIKAKKISMLRYFLPGEKEELESLYGRSFPDGGEWIKLDKDLSKIFGKTEKKSTHAEGKDFKNYEDKLYTETGWKMCFIGNLTESKTKLFLGDPRPKQESQAEWAYWYKDLENDGYIATHMGNSRKRELGGEYHEAWLSDIKKALVSKNDAEVFDDVIRKYTEAHKSCIPVPERKSTEELIKEWEDHPYRKPRVVVVGNSSSILTRELGEFIDSFEIVIRVNKCLTAGYEKHTGSKTSIWSTTDNTRWKNFTPEKIENREVWFRSPRTAALTMCETTKEKLTNAMGSSKMLWRHMFKTPKPGDGIHPLFTSREPFPRLYWQDAGLEHEPCTGILTIAHAIGTYGNCAIVGFTFGTEDVNGGSFEYYRKDEVLPGESMTNEEHRKNQLNGSASYEEGINRINLARKWWAKGFLFPIVPEELEGMKLSVHEKKVKVVQ